VKYRNPCSNAGKCYVCKQICPIPGRDRERCLAAEVGKQSKYEKLLQEDREISEIKTPSACLSKQILQHLFASEFIVLTTNPTLFISSSCFVDAVHNYVVVRISQEMKSITVAEVPGTWAVYVHSDTGVVGSDSSRGMDVCFNILFAFSRMVEFAA
jgi:hypothetical protein